MDRAELSTEQVLKWDTPWEAYITTKLITGTCLQLLRRYDHKSERQQAALLDDMHSFFSHRKQRARREKTVKFGSSSSSFHRLLRWLWNGNWFIQEKSCKILSLIMSVRPKPLEGIVSNGEATHSKSTFTSINDVLNSLVEWLCSQMKN